MRSQQLVFNQKTKNKQNGNNDGQPLLTMHDTYTIFNVNIVLEMQQKFLDAGVECD